MSYLSAYYLFRMTGIGRGAGIVTLILVTPAQIPVWICFAEEFVIESLRHWVISSRSDLIEPTVSGFHPKSACCEYINSVNQIQFAFTISWYVFSLMAVEYYTVTENEAGQRIDNFLIRHLKQLPKSAIYRILRKGEVRVDKKRVKPEKKLELGESIRIPPIKSEADVIPTDKPVEASQGLLDILEKAVLREDEQLIFINKPSGLPVHGGSGHKLGLIEAFRQLRPNLPFVELAHRIDRDTSGVVILAKSRQALTELHDLFRYGRIDKRYLALVAGKWTHGRQHVTVNLGKEEGKRQKVQVTDEGKESETIFSPVKNLRGAALVEAQILTGRMHQIRVQLQHLGHPILGDDRYGDFALNRQFREKGLKRLFLHSASVNLVLHLTGRRYVVEAPLPDDLQTVVANLR